MVGSDWWDRTIHLMVKGKEREEETGVPVFPLKVHPSDVKHCTRLHFFDGSRLGTKPSIHEPLGDT
jgi:hypothetical protein